MAINRMKTKFSLFSRKTILCILATCMSPFLYAQATYNYFFYVQLTDKNTTPYTIDNPSAYLSQRAIDRRDYFGIEIDSTDLPINPNYINSVSSLATVFSQTKWLNGLTVKVTDSALVMPQIRNLSFVDFVEYTGKEASTNAQPVKPLAATDNSIAYGGGYNQINQMNGLFLHDQHYKGNGMQVAVIDAGFTGADTHAAFDSLRNQNRLLGTKDFAYQSSSVYNGHTHGSSVLSTMASNVPNTLIGTAPKASYWLLRSERNDFEYPVECDFWIAAAEFADSVGIDVINTSLGYTTFNEASLNFSYADMDGETVRASIAATKAAQKGIVVVNAAGNDGANSWHYIGTPSDAKGIIAVGAVDVNGTIGSFSSYGPASDGRVKPELSARGVSAAIGNFYTTNSYTVSNGTSFASPILAGMATCLLQSLKQNNVSFTIPDFIQALCQTASNYSTPSATLGYGIPDFQSAYNALTVQTSVKQNYKNDIFSIADNGENLLLKTNADNNAIHVTVYSSLGILLKNYVLTDGTITIYKSKLPKGIVLIKATNKTSSFTQKVIIR